MVELSEYCAAMKCPDVCASRWLGKIGEKWDEEVRRIYDGKSERVRLSSTSLITNDLQELLSYYQNNG